MWKIFNKYWRTDWVYNHITVPKHKNKLMKDIDYVNWDITESSIEILFAQFIDFYETWNRYERTRRWHLAERTHNIRDEFKFMGTVFIYLFKFVGALFYNPASKEYHKVSKREGIIYKLKKVWEYRCKEVKQTEEWNKMPESEQALEIFAEYTKHLKETKDWSINHYNAYLESEEIYRYIKFVRKENEERHEKALNEIYKDNEYFFSRFESILADENTKKFDHKYSTLKHKDNKATFRYTFNCDLLEVEFVENDKPLHFECEQDLYELDTEYAKRILDIRGYLWD